MCVLFQARQVVTKVYDLVGRYLFLGGSQC